MNCRRVGIVVVSVIAASLCAAMAAGPTPTAGAEGLEFFEQKIRPVLVEHCYECHAVGAKKVRGALLLDSREGVRKGGFNAPAIASDHRTAPVNSLGYLRVMFTVEDIDDTLARLIRLGARVVDEVVNYEDIYRLCYIRGPEGILIGLAEQLGHETSGENGT